MQEFALSDVQAFMGHSDIATTMIYVHHQPMHDAADRLSRFVAAATALPTTSGVTDGVTKRANLDDTQRASRARWGP